jgi:hypothetical protein
MPRDPVVSRGHLGGAGKYIEMDRLDKVVNMEEVVLYKLSSVDP